MNYKIEKYRRYFTKNVSCDKFVGNKYQQIPALHLGIGEGKRENLHSPCIWSLYISYIVSHLGFLRQDVYLISPLDF